MSKIFSWLHNHNLTHPLIALFMCSTGALIGLGILFAVFLLGFYYGREVRDGELHLGMNITKGLSTHGPLWAFSGFWPGNWSKDGNLDFWPVFVICVLFISLQV